MTTHTMRDKIGQPVVAVDTAEQIGEVKHFVVAHDASRIERLHIDGRKKNASFSEWADLESFGADRVMVSQAGTTDESDDERDIDAAKGDVELLGARILDTAGFEQGTVADATFDADDGSIVDVTTDDGTQISGTRLRSLGSYALVVDT